MAGLDSSKCAEAYKRIKEIVVELREDGPRDGEVDRARAYAAGSTARRSSPASARTTPPTSISARGAREWTTHGARPHDS